MKQDVGELRYRCCFVILHYKTIDETRSCIESIMQLDDIKRDAVVVVDNSYHISDTGRKLLEQYIEKENIFFITNYDNSFFSHGNNLGYQYAKKLGVKLIIATNSDTLFPQKDFCVKLLKAMKKHSFYVCGPNIVEAVSGSGTSPIAWECSNKKETMREIEYYHNECERIRGGISNELNKAMSRRCPKIFLPVRNWQMEVMKKWIFRKHQYPVLQGSCIIVSWLYTLENDKLFYPETELYGEEQLLSFRCRENGYKIWYEPKLKVIHKGGVSVSNDYSDMVARTILTYERMIKAREIYLEYIGKRE